MANADSSKTAFNLWHLCERVTLKQINIGLI